MTILRVLGLLLTGVLAAAACLGFAVAQSLADPAPFVARMDEALREPAVRQEIKDVVRSEVLATADRLAANAGPLGELARAGAPGVADRMAAQVDSAAFGTAWSSWSALLYEGLAEDAVGAADPQVSVSGSVITVAIEPLLVPLIGDSLAGDLDGVLQFLGRDTSVSITTALPIEQILQFTTRLAQLRWVLLIAAAVAAALTTLAGGRRRSWLAAVLLWSAVCLALVGGVIRQADSVPTPGSDYPELSRAVTSSVTAPWANLLLVAAMIVAVIGAVVAVVALISADRSRRGPE